MAAAALLRLAPLLLAGVPLAAAQTVTGTAYGFASGATGGGAAAAATPSSVAELAEWLSDDEARTIVIDREWDFTGTTATGTGCDRNSCSVSNGGQFYLGDLSCDASSSDIVAVSSITYDTAGPSALAVGSNKSIVGSSNGKGVLRGKGLSFVSGASNVVVQGITITDINPGVVWGGDALDFKGSNDGVWVDHCRISRIGRQFAVSHYTGSRITLSNNELDGVTDTSASCNGNHYWTMMFIADGDRVTLDRNWVHDVAGRAPKLGADGVSGTFQATNNYFQNMQGHAFDAYAGARALIEGNVFDAVDTPLTSAAVAAGSLYTVGDAAAAAACEASLGRACAANQLSASGEWAALEGAGVLDAIADAAGEGYVVTPVDAGQVAALVVANAGPGKVGASEAGAEEQPAATTTTTAAAEVTPVETAPATGGKCRARRALRRA
jgi:pectate lyase